MVIKIVVLISATIFSSIVNSAVIFTMDRVSDNVVHITATGTIDGVPPVEHDHVLSFKSPFEDELANMANADIYLPASTMQIGGDPIEIAYTMGPTWSDADGVSWLYFGNDTGAALSNGAITGTLILALDSSYTFAPNGTSGLVTWGLGASGNNVGTWVMGSSSIVPVPSAVWLFGSGLLGLIGVARRKNNA